MNEPPATGVTQASRNAWLELPLRMRVIFATGDSRRDGLHMAVDAKTRLGVAVVVVLTNVLPAWALISWTLDFWRSCTRGRGDGVAFIAWLLSVACALTVLPLIGGMVSVPILKLLGLLGHKSKPADPPPAS